MSQTTSQLATILGALTMTESGRHRWECKPTPPMRVPARVITDREGIDALLEELRTQDWSSLRQLVNITTLPGIVGAALAMADVHPGYGFPIGGVAAFDTEHGVVSMAGVGFDINCGMRTLRTPLHRQDLTGSEETLLNELWRDIPAGLGSEGDLVLNTEELDQVLTGGAPEVVRRGYGLESDLEFIEEGGRLAGADAAVVSDTAKRRQRREVGTLGAGNHFVEVQAVDEILDESAATTFGLERDGIVISLHTGSRALGHQIGNDYLQVLERARQKYGVDVPDREMAAAPITSPEARQYLAAVQAGANCAFANRQVLAHLIRQTVARVFSLQPEQIETLYEVCHNTAKFETHIVAGEDRRLLVHRKGATRAFGPGRPEVPQRYRSIGQPVIVGGTMGTSSYILHGTPVGMAETFGSALHGAGRAMSRHKATKQFESSDIRRKLLRQGTHVRAHGRRSLAEEAPGAYKDVERIVSIMSEAGIVRPVARLEPVVCIKG